MLSLQNLYGCAILIYVSLVSLFLFSGAFPADPTLASIRLSVRKVVSPLSESKNLRVQTLGAFSLTSPTGIVSDGDNRTKKVWLFLAYMIYRRDRAIEGSEYINFLWGEEDQGANPANALKTILHRARQSLEPLWPGAGHQLILRQGSAYRWNTEFPLELDIDEFDRLCRQGEANPNEEERLTDYLAALALYHGDFLPRQSSHLWVLPISAHYHQMYVQLVLQTIPLLAERSRYREMAEVCRAALVQEPYLEELYRHLMEALIQLGAHREAATVYEDMAKLFMANFGVMPEESTRALYRTALSTLHDHALPMDSILDQLREPEGPNGALICQYDTFRSIYHSVARSLVRSGDAVHLALISVHHRNRSEELPRRSLDRVMSNLREIIRSSLRRGDVAAQCSVSQFLLMLPQANFENSQMVCDRILKAFARKYPHSPAQPQVAIFPLEPN